MKILSSKYIKKALFGVVMTDGSVVGKRFSIYLKDEELIDNLIEILNHFPALKVTKHSVVDRRFSPPATGYKVWTTNSPYFEKLRKIFYPDGRKQLDRYIISRLDEVSLAYAWMCDGFLDHAKNKKTNKIQNNGYFCLERFTKNELELLVTRLEELGVSSRLTPVVWGNGFRIKISGKALQRFIDLIYPYVTESFKYKTVLYYKENPSNYILNDLSNAEHIIKTYNNVEDIIRHSQ